MTEESIDPQSTAPTDGTGPAGQEAGVSGGALAKAGDVLPPVIHLLPVVERPFFPAQVMPVIVDAETWMDTLKAVHDSRHGVIGVVHVDTGSRNEARAGNFRSVGTACRIHQIQRHDDDLHIILVGMQRFQIDDWLSRRRPFLVRVRYHVEAEPADPTDIKAYSTAIINVIKELLPLNPLYGEELRQFMQHFGPADPSRLADFAASLTTAGPHELQEVLETFAIEPRLEQALRLLHKELEIARAQMEIRKHVEREMQSRQREVFLREQLKFIQKELGISKDDREAEVEKMRGRLEGLVIPDGPRRRIDEELEKMSVLERGSPEYTVTRNYLDWLTGLPWGRHSEDSLDIERARQVLDRDHEGLDDVKQRILEFLAVGRMRGEVGGSILLLIGPPGVGKTSLGRSVADTLGRRFYRFSLGGMRDEAEIKGHRRTYIGAMPGKFIQAIREAGTANPVIMLDEVDKIGASYHGDPASALLEVLDPEQNQDFLDHYLDVRFDLSKVLFICTANQLDTIPAPLLDRMEVLKLSGYLAAEKLEIARKHLVPRQLERAGLRRRGQFRIVPAALRRIIEEYAREAGVRRLDKLIGTIVRKAVVALQTGPRRQITVRAGDVPGYLGQPLFRREPRRSGVGVVTGLAWTPLGGATLTVEATRVHGFTRGFRLTGQLGEVMRESAEIAYSYIAAHASRLGADPRWFEHSFVHLHVPAGATPKDGPSAGITMAGALLSLCLQRRPDPSLAMTGELTLTGDVLPVGGIREKVIAARRAGFRRVVLPEANRADWHELPEHVRAGVEFLFVSRFAQVARLLYPNR